MTSYIFLLGSPEFLYLPIEHAVLGIVKLLQGVSELLNETLIVGVFLKLEFLSVFHILNEDWWESLCEFFKFRGLLQILHILFSSAVYTLPRKFPLREVHQHVAE